MPTPVLQALYEGREEDARAAAKAAGDALTLVEAAALGDDLTVRLMLQAHWGEVGDLCADGFTPLHYAAFFGRFDVLKTLIDARADVSAVSDNPMALQPLHAACAADHKTEQIAAAMAAALLRAGADPNAAQAGGSTPLLAARQSGWALLEKILLAAGAVV